ncbi:MAG: VanZ family protein [Paludibacteraceae bacterium]|nr:VanZ family protein [Paludibacteraceae bacterium]
MKALNYKYSMLIAACIVYLSLMKPPSIDSPLLKIENIDKVIHAIMYATLSLAMAFESNVKNNSLKILPVFIISTTFGGVIELLQSYFPPRTASWGDFIADAIGSVLPLVILLIVNLTHYGRERESNANSPEYGGRNRSHKG